MIAKEWLCMYHWLSVRVGCNGCMSVIECNGCVSVQWLCINGWVESMVECNDCRPMVESNGTYLWNNRVSMVECSQWFRLTVAYQCNGCESMVLYVAIIECKDWVQWLHVNSGLWWLRIMVECSQWLSAKVACQWLRVMVRVSEIIEYQWLNAVNGSVSMVEWSQWLSVMVACQWLRVMVRIFEIIEYQWLSAVNGWGQLTVAISAMVANQWFCM